MTPCETYEHEGVTVSIYYDEDAESPREWCNTGTMVCWHRRYNLGDEQASLDYDSMEELAASLDARIILPLYLYDHSGLSMSTGSFNDPWDSGQVGFIYATADDIREAFMVKRITAKVAAQAEESLRSEVSAYDSFLQGECYGYIVDRDGDDEGSCWGFVGDIDYCKQEANSVAEYVAKERRAPDRIFVDGVPIEEALYALSTAGGTGKGTR